jgi:hypothetical protein
MATTPDCGQAAAWVAPEVPSATRCGPSARPGSYRRCGRAVRRAAALVAPAVRAIGRECPGLDFTGLDFLEVPGNDPALLPVRVAGLDLLALEIAPECCQVRERQTGPGDPVPAFDP